MNKIRQPKKEQERCIEMPIMLHKYSREIIFKSLYELLDKGTFLVHYPSKKKVMVRITAKKKTSLQQLVKELNKALEKNKETELQIQKTNSFSTMILTEVLFPAEFPQTPKGGKDITVEDLTKIEKKLDKKLAKIQGAVVPWKTNKNNKRK